MKQKFGQVHSSPLSVPTKSWELHSLTLRPPLPMQNDCKPALTE